MKKGIFLIVTPRFLQTLAAWLGLGLCVSLPTAFGGRSGGIQEHGAQAPTGLQSWLSFEYAVYA